MEVKLIILSLAFLLLSLLSTHARATVYTVGDAEGWDTGINYLSWSEKYNFTVGDVLGEKIISFNYVKSQHNAYEVTEDTYRSCDGSEGVVNKYESGQDKVTLTEEKKYWFICNVSGHCLGGMKVGIQVTAAAVANNGGAPIGAASNPTGVPPGDSGVGSGMWRGGGGWVGYLVLMLLNYVCMIDLFGWGYM
ncbi:hypothetical protein QJS04_geneDACA009646 [Acorus gramineus]|uniref:Phytocyanin domain-containing protein n=1 Tax=Acorus gramineus TaxID=55184 RepID=A0AAV9B8E0_ACOGR|nr:hypothetical protein QJS04_geneDACA009646 [Acorus gramineus]